jgi:chitodextrinase
VARGNAATVARSVHVDDVVVSSTTGTADLVPPSAPSGLTATSVGQTQVGLAWTAATDDVGVTGYQVLRDGFLVGTPSGTAYTDTGLAPAGTYTYTVRAVDGAGNLGPASNAVTVTTTAASSELYATAFTGADGAAWPAGWTTATAAGGTASLRSNAGQLAFSNSSGSYARAQLTGLAARADSDITFSYRWRDPAAKGYLNLTLRGSGGWAGAYRPASGYGLEFTSTTTSVTVKEVAGGTTSTLATLANAQAMTTAKQWVRLRVSGSTIQVKTWPDGQPEPTAWRTSITDTTVTAAGQVYLSYVRSSTATAGRAVDVDDLVVTAG